MNDDISTEKIWDEFSGRIRGYVLKNTRDVNAADDILQEIFIKIHSGIQSLRDDSKIRSWIFAIARNSILDYVRSGQSHSGPESSDAAELENMSEEQYYENTPAHEMAEGLRDMILKSLPEMYSEAIILADLEGMSQAELADRLSISLSGAKSRVQRARQMLKDSLMKCCHFEFDRHGTITDIYPACCCCSKTR